MSDIIGIGMSALRAAETRASVAASNIANMHSGSAVDDTGGSYSGYVPHEPVQTTTEGAGVIVGTRPAVPAHTVALQSDGGLHGHPNADLTTEVLRLQEAKRAYTAGASLIRTGDEMGRTLLDAV